MSRPDWEKPDHLASGRRDSKNKVPGAQLLCSPACPAWWGVYELLQFPTHSPVVTTHYTPSIEGNSNAENTRAKSAHLKSR